MSSRGLGVSGSGKIGGVATTARVYQHVGFRGSGREGAPCIARTGFKVRLLAELHIGEGLTVDEIAEEYGLTQAEVHAGLAYYYDHRAEIDAEIRELDELVAALSG